MMQGLTWSKKHTGSVRGFTDKELAWERAELAWDSLGYNSVDFREDEDNVLIKALDGIAEFFQWGNRSNVKPHVKKRNSIHRRLKAEDREQINENGSDEKESLLSSLRNSPLAASVLVLVGMISIVASFIASSDSRRLNRMAARYEGRTIVMDEEEAEILEFYEKEMEAGSFKRMLSFDVMGEDDLGSADEAQPSSIGSEVEVPLHLRSDAYYTQVLQNEGEPECIEVDESKQDAPVQDEVSEIKCQDAPSSTGASIIEDHQGCIVKDCQGSSQGSSQDDFYDCESNPSPQQSQSESLSSSISSLTSEMYPEDIKASFSFSTVGSEEDLLNASTTLSVAESYKELHQALNQTGTSPLHETESTPISATADTPLITNVFRAQAEDTPRPPLERRVSFNPEVKVKEIPRREMRDQFSSERYLYFMLALVGIVVIVFSFFPAHPSLSPIASMTRKEVLRRADSILSSQFDVEL